MIVIERPKLRFLMAGRAVDVEVPEPARYRKGRVYALGVTHQNTTCRVEVMAVTEAAIKVRLPQIDKPLLLAKRSQYGYVEIDPDDPALNNAMNDEPEPVSPQELERINRRHRERIATFRGDIIATVDMLAESASAADARRLRNLRRIAASL